MDGYKKIIKSQRVRFMILNMLQWIPDKLMLKIQYRIKMNKKLNCKSPKRFTEKVQLYKMNYKNELMHQCVDKYEVRNYVKSKGLERILNKCYAVYNSVDEIDFKELPDKFVIKLTNGGGGLNIIICDDKKKLDIEQANSMLLEWMKFKPKKSMGREWAYDTNTNKIIIEKYLVGNEDGLTGINDYKFFCFNGKVEYIVFDGDRYKKHKRNFYDKDWNYLDIKSDCDNFGNIIKRPEGLEQMKEIAEKLSEDFPFVRVDLYWIDNRVLFGELTFYPWSGYVQFYPDKFDYLMGEKFNI